MDVDLDNAVVSDEALMQELEQIRAPEPPTMTDDGGLVLLDDGPGGRTVFYYDEAEDKFALRLEQDVDPMLEYVKAVRGDRTLNEDSEGVWRRVAFIPDVVVRLWKTLYGVDLYDRNHLEAVVRLLNDPEWSALRTMGGKI
jgi:hypothetical protein